MQEKNQKPYCKFCKKELANNKCHIERHERSAGHIQVLRSLKNQPSFPQNANEHENFKKKISAVKTAELRVLMFLLQNNLPFCIIGALIGLIKAVAPVANDLKCERTKAIDTTNSVILNEGLEETAQLLRDNPFSLIIDETTDVATSKCLALVARYFDDKSGTVQDRFWGIIELLNCTAESIYKTICDMFIKSKVPFENLIGFASDNASVMMGRKGGVKSFLLNKCKHLYVLGCTCHSLHLCSSAAGKSFPKELKISPETFIHFLLIVPNGKQSLRTFKNYSPVRHIRF